MALDWPTPYRTPAPFAERVGQFMRNAEPAEAADRPEPGTTVIAPTSTDGKPPRSPDDIRESLARIREAAHPQ
jgi:hypothetical protein